MAVRYKQKCWRCKKNYVTVSSKQKYATCYECQQSELQGDIKDPTMKKLFAIPEDFYKTNSFLRNIKASYLQYGSLTDRQIEAFKDVVKKLQERDIEEKKE